VERRRGSMNAKSLRLWRSSRLLTKLVGISLVTEIIYLLAFLVPFPLLAHYTSDTDMAGLMHHATWGFVLFCVAFTSLFALMGAASVIAGKSEGIRSDPRAVMWVLGLAAVFVITLVFVYPVTAIDIFNYIAESRILVHYHQNPIFVAPIAHPHDPVMVLSGGWETSTAPYGPLGIVADAWPAVVVGGNVLWNLLLLKLTFGVLLLGNGLAAYRLLSKVRPDLALSGTILVAWNPLLLFESVANGHNDILMLFLATLGLLGLVENRWGIGLFLIGASALVKFATLPILPLAILFILSRNVPSRHKLQHLLLGTLGIGVLTWLTYRPFWEGWSTMHRALDENSFGLQSFGSAATWIFPGLSTSEWALVGRVVLAPVYLFACYLAMRTSEDMLKGVCLAMLGFLALAAGNVKIWYLAWPAVLGALASDWYRVTVVVAALGATLSAAVWAYAYNWIGLANNGFSWVNWIAYVMTFAPMLLLLGSLGHRRHLGDTRSHAPEVRTQVRESVADRGG
jgi:hypothetical protein